MQEELTFSPAGSHDRASHSLSPGSEKARKMTVTSGLRCLELYSLQSPGGSLLKMLAASLLGTKGWFSKLCYLTWKEKVTKSRRLLFQLVPKTPATGGTESGLLRTLDAGADRGMRSKETIQGRIKRGMPMQLNDQLQAIRTGILPTVQARDWKKEPSPKHKAYSLPREIGKMHPTLHARDWKGGTNERRNHETLPDLIGGTSTKLNPDKLDWFMGYPIGWTDTSVSNRQLVGQYPVLKGRLTE